MQKWHYDVCGFHKCGPTVADRLLRTTYPDDRCGRHLRTTDADDKRGQTNADDRCGPTFADWILIFCTLYFIFHTKKFNFQFPQNFFFHRILFVIKRIFPNSQIPIQKCSSSHPNRKTYFFPIFKWLWTPQICISKIIWVSLPLQLKHGSTSKVTSLQALLHKAFRSPGVLVKVTSDFLLIFTDRFAQEKNKPKILTCFA